MTNYVPKKPRDFDDPDEVGEAIREIEEWRPEVIEDSSLDEVRYFSTGATVTIRTQHYAVSDLFPTVYINARSGFERLTHLVKLMEYEKRHGQGPPIRNSSLACCGR